MSTPTIEGDAKIFDQAIRYFKKDFARIEKYYPFTPPICSVIPTAKATDLVSPEIARLETDPLAYDNSRLLGRFRRVTVPKGTPVRVYFSGAYLDYTATQDLHGTLNSDREAVQTGSPGDKYDNLFSDRPSQLFEISLNWPEGMEPIYTDKPGIFVKVANDRVKLTQPEESSLTAEELINREIARHKQFNQTGKTSLFNNMHLNLPGQDREKVIAENERLGHHYLAYDSRNLHSAKRLNQSDVEFFRTCDEAMAEAGVTAQEFIAAKAYNDSYFSPDYHRELDNYDEVRRRIYIQLFRRGYSQADIAL